MCILFLKSARCSLKLRTPLLRFCFATVLFIPMNGYINFRTHLQPVDQWASDVLYFTEHEWMLMVGAHSPSSIPLKICSPSDLSNFLMYKVFLVQVTPILFSACLSIVQDLTFAFDLVATLKKVHVERKLYIYIYIYVCVYFIFNRSFSFTKQSLYNRDHCSP